MAKSVCSKYEKLCAARDTLRGMGIYNTWKNMWKEMVQVTDEGCDAIIASYIKKAEKVRSLHKERAET